MHLVLRTERLRAIPAPARLRRLAKGHFGFEPSFQLPAPVLRADRQDQELNFDRDKKVKNLGQRLAQRSQEVISRSSNHVGWATRLETRSTSGRTRTSSRSSPSGLRTWWDRLAGRRVLEPGGTKAKGASGHNSLPTWASQRTPPHGVETLELLSLSFAFVLFLCLVACHIAHSLKRHPAA